MSKRWCVAALVTGSTCAGAVLIAAALGAVLSPLAAQERRPPQDTLPPVDSFPPADTMGVAAVVPPPGPSGPLPLGSRIIFTADSLEWSGAETLADLLARVPGVYVGRAGVHGQPEVVFYGGRGGAAVEIYWDGVALDPLGLDSIYADASRIPLAFLERVEVLVRPAALRVDAVSRRHDRLATHSMVRVLQGKFDAAAYRGVFQHRYPSGVGLSLGFDWNQNDGATRSGGFRAVDLWVKGEWVPSERVGAVVQVWQTDTDRGGGAVDATGTGPVIIGRDVRRRQTQLAFFYDGRNDGRGLRLDGVVGAAEFGGDSGVTDQTLQQAWLRATYRQPVWSGSLEARARSRRTPIAIEGSLQWAGLRALALAVQGERRWHVDDRQSERATGWASLALPLGFRLRGVASVGSGPEAPALRSDTGVTTTDLAGFVAWTSRRAAVEVGRGRRDRFVPHAPPELTAVAALAASPESEYLVARASLSPLAGVTLAGWYEHPQGELVDFLPPHHSLATATLRSKFWRTFPSGAFDLKLEVQVESWSSGTAGFDAQGAPLILGGATFVHTLIEFQIVGFHAFWHMRNIALAQETYVPGYPYGNAIQSFGARWAFTN